MKSFPCFGGLPGSKHMATLLPSLPNSRITMNAWKPIAFLTTAGLVASVGYQTAHAQASIGSCGNQQHMLAAAKALYSTRDAMTQAVQELTQTPDNKGAWRNDAVSAANTAKADIAKAILATEKGCAYANAHPGG